MSTIRITAPSRLHIALLGMNLHLPYRNGGLGISLSYPSTTVKLKKATQDTRVQLCANAREHGPSILAQVQALRDLYPQIQDFELCVESAPPAHCGFGSHTALILSVTEGLLRLYELGYDRKTIVELSGRGGTSGVGVNSYFDGGFNWDVGVPTDGHAHFLPSSAAAIKTIPHRIMYCEVPRHFVIHLCIPDGHRVSGSAEKAFFNQNTPVPEVECNHAISLTAYGIVPAIQVGNADATMHSIFRLQAIGFKQREIEAQSEGVRSFMNRLNESGIQCGMSSLGPCVYTITDEDRLPYRHMLDICEQNDAIYIGSTRSSSGRLLVEE